MIGIPKIHLFDGQGNGDDAKSYGRLESAKLQEVDCCKFLVKFQDQKDWL